MSASFDVDALYVALDRARRIRRLSWRGLAVQAWVSPSLCTRIAHGRRPDVDSLARLLLWLGDTDIAPYAIGTPLRGHGNPAPTQGHQGTPVRPAAAISEPPEANGGETNE